jgi:hypothetical protein
VYDADCFNPTGLARVLPTSVIRPDLSNKEIDGITLIEYYAVLSSHPHSTRPLYQVLETSASHCSTRHAFALASRAVSFLLAVEIEEQAEPAQDFT